MNYHHDRQQYSNTPILIAFGVFLLAFLIFMFAAPPLRAITSAVWRSTEGWKQSPAFTSAQSLQQQNLLLHERVTFLQQQNALLRDDTLGITSFVSDGRYGVAAWVIHRQPYTFARQWMVDKGSKDGVIINDIAYAGDVVIGSITDVSEATSEVMPFFTPGSTTQVIHTPSGMSLTVEGRGQGVYYTEVPRDFEIQEEDLIQWQGASTTAIIGYVKSVLFDDRDALQGVFIALPENPKTIQWLEIEKAHSPLPEMPLSQGL